VTHVGGRRRGSSGDSAFRPSRVQLEFVALLRAAALSGVPMGRRSSWGGHRLLILNGSGKEETLVLEDVTVKVPARSEWEYQLNEWGILSRPVARQFGWAAMRAGDPRASFRNDDISNASSRDDGDITAVAAETIANILRIFPRGPEYQGAILDRAVEIAGCWEPMDTVRMGPHEWGGNLRASPDPLEDDPPEDDPAEDDPAEDDPAT
jgi:hypothetical protein